MNVSLWSGGRITFGKSFKRINKKAKIVNRNGNYTGLSVFFFFFFPSITADRLVLLCICFWGRVCHGCWGGGVSKNTVEILGEHIIEENIFTERKSVFV